MAGESDIGQTQIGSIAMALGKLEADREESQRQRAELRDQGRQTLTVLGHMREAQAAFHSRIDTVIGQLVADSTDHEERINDLEKAEQQRAGAGRMARVMERVITALFGGAAAIAANRIWPHG